MRIHQYPFSAKLYPSKNSEFINWGWFENRHRENGNIRESFQEYINRYESGFLLNPGIDAEKITNFEGLASTFAKLKTVSEMEAFTLKYGLLGIIEDTNNQRYRGDSLFESIDIWKDNILNVRRLMKLYNFIEKRKMDPEIDSNKIFCLKYWKVDPKNRHEAHLHKYHKNPETLVVYWNDDEKKKNNPGFFLDKHWQPPNEDMDFDEALAGYILSKQVTEALAGGVWVNFTRFDFVKNFNTGFKIQENLYPRYLISAIYYNLFEIINDKRLVHICEFQGCRLPFEKVGKRKYCSDACKQAAYRMRKKSTTTFTTNGP